MELLEDPTFKHKYQKYKLKVKLWESDFMDKYGRKPNKNDIREASSTIKEAYKIYWKLKTRALEETLTDITFCDDVQANIPVASPSSSIVDKKEENKQVELVNKDRENIDPHVAQGHGKPSEVLPTTSTEITNIDGAWGSHLKKSKEILPKKSNLLIGRSSSFQLSQNKFTSSSFAKRNPRKSLSANKLKNRSESNISIDSTASVGPNVTESNDGFDIIEESKGIFGESVKVVCTQSISLAKPINTIHQLVEGEITSANRKIDHGWLSRCSRESNAELMVLHTKRLSSTSDSGIESTESSIQSSQECATATRAPIQSSVSDEEDFILNSDSEEERRHKRVRNFNKRFSDEDGNFAKKPCLNREILMTGVKSVYTSQTTISDHKNKTIETVKQSTNHSTIEPIPPIESVKTATSSAPKVVEESDKLEKKYAGKKEVNSNLEPEQKAKTQRKIRRKVRHVSSDGSDDDHYDPKYIDKEKKVKQRRPRKTDAKQNVTKSEKRKNTEPSKKFAVPVRRKSTRNRNKDVAEEEKLIEIENGENQIPIYGIETLEATPRFPIPATGDGNLVEEFSKSVSVINSNTEYDSTVEKGLKKLTDKEKFEKKVATGTLNDNFVRINLKKKVFVRGKKSFNFSKYKKNQWKQRKKELASSEGSLDLADLAEKNGGVLACFKCGETGHFARFCPAGKSDELIPLDQVDETSDFPTLEEAEKMASQGAVSAHGRRIDRLPEKPSVSYSAEKESVEEMYVDDIDEELAQIDEEAESQNIPCAHKIPQELLSKLLPPKVDVVDPLYNVGPDQSLIATPPEVFETLHMFQHEKFRSGQEKAIMRILSGQSTLVTLSTGSGKSLCYQLPAYLYAKHRKCITLVVSPLVSLMDDQVTGVPAFLSAAALHTSQSPKVRENIVEMVKQGQINILLVSPEAVVAGEKSTGFGALLRQLPPIAFACIDEAHCISQWSHNFRPSYLMICRVLREKLRVKTILGLTATATKATAESIVQYLGIHDGINGIISDTPMPKNLYLTVSQVELKDNALVKLLLSDRFKDCDSIIIYCTRREECVRVASFLRISLQNHQQASQKQNAKVSDIAEAYHAGLSAYRRKIVQKAFMNGQTRIVVATVAFGMGINKADIRSVIHYNMPGSFEGYVQEVGRAGRDGLTAQCHLFLNPKEHSDKWELQRHIYSNGVDRHVIRRLLQKVFIPCSCTKTTDKKAGRRCPGHEVAIPVDETVRALDVSEETISTLLCYLELHPRRYITVLSSVYVKARVSSYGGSQALKAAAQSSPPLAMAIALDSSKGISHENSNLIEFPIVEVASAIGWDSGVAKSHLKNLEWKTVNGHAKRTAISVRFDTLGLRVKAPGDLSDTELDEALEALVTRTQVQETSRLQQLEAIHSALTKYSVQSVQQCLELTEEMKNKSEDLKNTIRSYFQSDLPLDNISVKSEIKLPNEGQIAADVRNLVLSYRDNNFNGRAVARIFHGIQSPNYPALIWSKCPYWRAHLSSNFYAICQIATREILALR